MYTLVTKRSQSECGREFKFNEALWVWLTSLMNKSKSSFCYNMKLREKPNMSPSLLPGNRYLLRSTTVKLAWIRDAISVLLVNVCEFSSNAPCLSALKCLKHILSIKWNFGRRKRNPPSPWRSWLQPWWYLCAGTDLSIYEDVQSPLHLVRLT